MYNIQVMHYRKLKSISFCYSLILNDVNLTHSPSAKIETPVTEMLLEFFTTFLFQSLDKKTISNAEKTTKILFP